MSKKPDWMSAPSLTGSTFFSVFPSGCLVFNSAGERAGMGLGISVKNGTAKSSGFGSGVSGLAFDPFSHFGRMGFLPVGDIGGIAACQP